ncbi:MAG: hypothetical protein WB610_14830, partial [Rhodomicrobium sp.]
VQVRCDEGIANHIGPEPCAVVREDLGEASVGDCIGQPLSREIDVILGADAVRLAEGNTDGCATASARPAQRGRRPWHVRTLLAREPGDLMLDQGGSPLLARIGKARSRSR